MYVIIEGRGWLVLLLMIGIYVSFTQSYGDEQFIENDNNADVSKRDTFDSLIASVQAHHRAKRALNDSTSE